MKKRLILMLAAMLVGQVTGAHAAGTRRALAQAETTDRVKSAAEVLPICEKGLAALAAGADVKAAILAEVKDLPAEQQQAVLLLCGFYLAGAVSLAHHMQEAAPKLSGGTAI